MCRDEGEKALRAVLAQQEKHLGPTDEHTLTTRHHLLMILKESGRTDEAERECRDLLAKRLRVSGPEHPKTIGCLKDLCVGWDRGSGRGGTGNHEIPQTIILSLALPKTGPRGFIMDPKKSLLFTPRMSPGERRLREARRQLMHASEDAPVKKIDPRDKDILRPPPTPVSPQQAAVAYSLAQAADPAKYPPTREQMERINSSARFVPPQEKSPMRRLLEHFSGTAGYGTTVPHGEEPADAHVDLEFHSNPGMDKAEERRKQLERPISPPETNGPEQEPKLVDPDDEKDDEEEP